MPDLPTLTLGQAHFDRVVAAFPGATAAGKVAAYKAWLVNRLIERVELVESRKIDAAANTAKQTALATLAASLPAKAAEADIPGAAP